MIVFYWGGVNLNLIRKKRVKSWKRMQKSLITIIGHEERDYEKTISEEVGPVTFRGAG